MSSSVAVLGDGLASRVFGSSPVRTALALARRTFTSADTVVLARDDDYADGLAGAPLAGQHAGPLLLNGSDHLDPLVAAELHRLGARTAVLLGGVGALGPQVEAEVRAQGLTVERIAGADRFATAAAIAAELPGTAAYVVEGLDADPRRGWPDAVAVSGLAAFQHRMILLVGHDEIPPATQQVLDRRGIAEVTVVGGTAAVSAATEQRLRDQHRRVDRVAGSTRYETSVALVERSAAAGMDATNVTFTPGATWAETLVAGAASGTTGHPVLLVDDAGSAAQPAAAWLDGRRGVVQRVAVVAAPVALSPATVVAVVRHAGSPTPTAASGTPSTTSTTSTAPTTTSTPSTTTSTLPIPIVGH
jgi:hypothetical protein